MPVRHLAFVLAVVLLGASPAPADPPGAERPHPAHLDGVVHDVDFGTGVVTLESAGRSFAVTVPGTTPIKEGTATRSIIDFKAGVTRLHIEGSALGRHVTAASIEIKV